MGQLDKIPPCCCIMAESPVLSRWKIIVLGKDKETIEFEVKSSAFDAGDSLPVLYTCDGQNISPPLSWVGTPGNTRSLALFLDDITSPYGTWCHWVLYNIAADYRILRKNIPPERMLPWKGVQGRNDYDRIGYAGPCPPDGEERQYAFRLFALDCELEVEPRITRLLLLKQMKGSIIDRAELLCTYTRNRLE